MSNVPRIEAPDASTAVSICVDLLHLIEGVAFLYAETDFKNPDLVPWHGVSTVAKVVRNTLTAIECEGPDDPAAMSIEVGGGGHDGDVSLCGLWRRALGG